MRIEQGRFADVRPTDQCDYGQHECTRRLVRRDVGARSREARLRGSAAAGCGQVLGIAGAATAGAAATATRGVARKAASLPLSVSTTTVSLTAIGGLLTRNLATRWRATSSPVRLVQPVQIALVVRHGDRRARDCRRAQSATLQLVVAPDLRPVTLAQRDHDAVGLRHEQVLLIHREAAIARHVVRPPDLARSRARSWPCVPESPWRTRSRRRRSRPNRRRPAGRVPFCRAAWRAPCPTPYRRSSSDTAMTLPLSNPLTAISLAMTGMAVPRRLKRGTCCSTDQSSLPWLASKPCKRPSTERITTTFSLIAGAERSSEFTRVRHSSLPLAPSQRDHPAFGRAHDHHPRACAGAGRELHVLELLHPYLTAALEIDRDQLALVGGGEHRVRRRGRPEAEAQLHLLLAAADLVAPQFLDRKFLRESRRAWPAARHPCPCCSRRSISKAARANGSNARIRVWPCSRRRERRGDAGGGGGGCTPAQTPRAPDARPRSAIFSASNAESMLSRGRLRRAPPCTPRAALARSFLA